MRAISSIFCYYVKGNIHVSVALIALLHLTAQRFQVTVPLAYYGALFFGSIAGYNVIKTLATEQWFLLRGADQYPRVRLLVLCSAICAAIGVFFLEFRFALGLGITLLLTVLYAIPVRSGSRNLRSFGVLKIVWVAAVWTLLTFVIPLGISANMEGWIFSVAGVQRWLWMILLMLPFEIRDLGIDPTNLQTLPRRLGLPKTRILGWVLAVLLFIFTVILEGDNIPILIADAFAFLLSGWSVQRSGPNRGMYFAAFWVEAIPIGVCLVQTALLYG